jgi:hypothetical protein
MELVEGSCSPGSIILAPRLRFGLIITVSQFSSDRPVAQHGGSLVSTALKGMIIN